MAQYLNLEAASPRSTFVGVMVNVARATEPSDFERLAVIVVVPVCARVAATLARLPHGVRFSCRCSREHPLPKVAIAAVAISLSVLDSLGVTRVEGAVESLDSIPARLGQIAAAL